MIKLNISWFLFGRQTFIPEDYTTSTNYKFCRLYYVFEGECIYKDNSQTEKLESGHFYLLPAKSFSLNYGPNKKFSHLWGHFQCSDWDFDRVIKFNVKSDPIFTDYINLLDALSEKNFIISDTPTDMTTLFQDNIFFTVYEKVASSLLNYIYFAYIDAKEKTPFDEILNYINDNLCGDLSNDTLAKVVKYSRTHFIQEFTKHYNIAPQKYVTKARISKAIVLLMNDEKLYNIALEVGYENPKSFSRAFKRETGISPLEYKRLHYYTIHKNNL